MYVYTHTHTYIHIHMPAHIFTYNYSTLTNSCVCRHFPQTCPQTCFFFWRESCQTFSKKIQICVYIHYWIYNNVPIFSAGLPAKLIFFLCDTTYSYVWHVGYMCDMTFICDMTHAYPACLYCLEKKNYVSSNVFICGATLIDLCSLIHLRFSTSENCC